MVRAKANENVESEEDEIKIDETSIGEAADMVVEAEAELASGESGVYYVGIFSERRISKQDWETAGVSNQEEVVWRKDMDKRIPLDKFTNKALEVLRGTGEFRIVAG